MDEQSPRVPAWVTVVLGTLGGLAAGALSGRGCAASLVRASDERQGAALQAVDLARAEDTEEVRFQVEKLQVGCRSGRFLCAIKDAKEAAMLKLMTDMNAEASEAYMLAGEAANAVTSERLDASMNTDILNPREIQEAVYVAARRRLLATRATAPR